MQQFIVKLSVPILKAEKVKVNYAYKQRCFLQKLLYSIVQTIVANCNNAYKSCHLQLLLTIDITALTQFWDFSQNVLTVLSFIIIIFLALIVDAWSSITQLTKHHRGWSSLSNRYIIESNSETVLSGTSLGN